MRVAYLPEYFPLMAYTVFNGENMLWIVTDFKFFSASFSSVLTFPMDITHSHLTAFSQYNFQRRRIWIFPRKNATQTMTPNDHRSQLCDFDELCVWDAKFIVRQQITNAFIFCGRQKQKKWFCFCRSRFHEIMNRCISRCRAQSQKSLHFYFYFINWLSRRTQKA